MDIGELLLNMADKLNVSPAFLSGVENGKRKIPEGWLSKIANIYGLSDEQKEKMQAAFYDSNNEIGIELHNLQANQRDLAIAFARKLDTIPESDISRILNILNKEKK